ncbi:uncharacterized protein JCM15063_005824 [Sporobolomyces koalae]|uniref:uncharacterized protein n=1 Tax=Sporobolomyces koalae TaxID=500713 RepID=UPI003179B644
MYIPSPPSTAASPAPSIFQQTGPSTSSVPWFTQPPPAFPTYQQSPYLPGTVKSSTTSSVPSPSAFPPNPLAYPAAQALSYSSTTPITSQSQSYKPYFNTGANSAADPSFPGYYSARGPALPPRNEPERAPFRQTTFPYAANSLPQLAMPTTYPSPTYPFNAYPTAPYLPTSASYSTLVDEQQAYTLVPRFELPPINLLDPTHLTTSFASDGGAQRSLDPSARRANDCEY